MSVDYYIACSTCHKAIHVAQDGLGGFTFYRGQPDTMKLLGEFLEAHSRMQSCNVCFLPEHVIDRHNYAAVSSTGEPLPDD